MNSLRVMPENYFGNRQSTQNFNDNRRFKTHLCLVMSFSSKHYTFCKKKFAFFFKAVITRTKSLVKTRSAKGFNCLKIEKIV